MRRREFIAGLGGAVAWPLATGAQQAERVRRVGVLTYDFDTPRSRSGFSIFRDALEQLGWSEGRNLRLDVRLATEMCVRLALSRLIWCSSRPT
jgi:putative tryptophan/tyrosine transport system substrate-binding protein